MDKSTEEFLKTLNKFRFIKTHVKVGQQFCHAEHFLLATILDCMEVNKDLGKPNQGATVSEITNQLGATMAAVSKMLRGMEAKGLIIREASEADRRNVYIRLSDKGIREHQSNIKQMETMMDRVITKMGKKDAEMLNGLFLKFYEAAKEVMKEDEDLTC